MTGKRCLVVLLAVAAIGGLAAATPGFSDARTVPQQANPMISLSLAESVLIPDGQSTEQRGPMTDRASSKMWTTCADFSGGVSINVHCPTGSGRLERNVVADTAPLPYVWVACSGSTRDTVVKIDATSGAVLGEYRTAPSTSTYPNPSRTTVDLDGDAWVANRNDDYSSTGSAAKFGQVIGGTRVNAGGTPDPNGDYLQGPFTCCNCEDRNGDGLIYTSRGLGDIRSWDNTNGADTDGGVDNAQDECILRYLRVAGTGTRTIAVNADNNVWIGGTGDFNHELYDGFSGQPVAGTLFNLGCGGYGGLVDCNGVLWSASYAGASGLLWYDTNPTPIARVCKSVGGYGLGYDPFTGNVWGTDFGSGVTKIDPLGNAIQYCGFGGSYTRGVAVDNAGDVWVANSGDSSVSRLNSSCVELKQIDLGTDGSAPTGVAIDAAGKVWATCMNSNTAKRIDPNAGTDHLGEVDLTVPLGSGATPYNYSDLTGMVALHTSASGTWTDVYDSSVLGTAWNLVTWNTETCVADPEPDGTSVTVGIRAANTKLGLASLDYVEAHNGQPLSGCVYGRFVQVRVRLRGTCPAGSNVSPSLCDLTVSGDSRVDCNMNGIPDECESGCPCRGDLNGDCGADGLDVQSFVCCILDAPPLCVGVNPNCTCADLNGDGEEDIEDIAGFVEALLFFAPICLHDGACCLSDGSCRVMTWPACEAANGEFAGDDTSCGAEGACCLTDGSCEIMVAACCLLEGGDFAGPGTTCAPVGACCMPDDSCEVLAQACCSQAGGAFAGAGTTCVETGACCKSDGSCEDTTRTGCCAYPGAEFHVGAACGGTGACCLLDGSCQDVAEVCCLAQDGAWAGPGTSCGTLIDCNGNGVMDYCDIHRGKLYAISHAPSVLYTINPANGVATYYCTPSGYGFTNALGLSINPRTGDCFVITDSWGSGPQWHAPVLVKLDLDTCVATYVGLGGLRDIAFHDNGTLYGIDGWDGRVYIIDTTDGTQTATACQGSESPSHSITFKAGTNLLYHHFTTTGGETAFETIDVTTCPTPPVQVGDPCGDASDNYEFDCLAFTPDGDSILAVSNAVEPYGKLYATPADGCDLVLRGSSGYNIAGLAWAYSRDCNGNGIPDECEVPQSEGCPIGLCVGDGCLPDCNQNCIPDNSAPGGCETAVCGRCCHEDTGICEDGVGQENCQGPCDDFSATGSCAELPAPLCGLAACCLSSGQCQLETLADCDTLGGAWHRRKTCEQITCDPPSNDLCENAITLTGTCVTSDPFDTTDATRDGFTSDDTYYTIGCLRGGTEGQTDDDTQVANNIWYKWVVPTSYEGYPIYSGRVVISTLGSQFDTVLSVYAAEGATGDCIDCEDVRVATEIWGGCNDDIVLTDYPSHEQVQLSYVQIEVDEYGWVPPGACLLIMVGGKIAPDSPCSPRGGLGQLNIDFIPTSSPWNQFSGVCCTATGCFIATYAGSGPGECNFANYEYFRPTTDFYEGATDPAPPPPFEASAHGCCHGEFGSCQEGEFCGKAIDLGTTPNGTIAWSQDVHRVTYFKFTPRDLISPETEYYLTIDTCDSEFDTVLSVYGPNLVSPTGDCDEAEFIARNDNCLQGVPYATSHASCFDDPGEADSCVCLKVEGEGGLLFSGETYYIGVGKKDMRTGMGLPRGEGIDPVPNYPIDHAVGLTVTIKDTWTNCGS